MHYSQITVRKGMFMHAYFLESKPLLVSAVYKYACMQYCMQKHAMRPAHSMHQAKQLFVT